MFEAQASPYLIPTESRVEISELATAPPADAVAGKAAKRKLREIVDEIDELQRILYAHDRHSLLLIFQAMDAAGKDGTIRAVMRGINPAGCQVFSFKQPSKEENDHDFLWRSARRLPERGRIGIFNRSYYEEVLVVRVHPEFLEGQNLPDLDMTRIWDERFQSIRDHELHLARNGTVIVKFWLNVSLEEQRRRFLDRLLEPEKNWKFSRGDMSERALWPAYMQAYAEALGATSRSWAPWYAIPADDKPYMRLQVATIVRDTLASLDLRYPEADEEDRSHFAAVRAQLEGEG